MDDNIFEAAETIALSLDADVLPDGALAEGSTIATVRIDDLSATPSIHFTVATAETITFGFGTLTAGVVEGTPTMLVVTIASSDTDAMFAISALDGRDAVRVYPNPVRAVLHISVPSSAAYEAVLYTLAGVPILSSASPTSLAVDALPPGVYFLSIFFDGTTYLHRLLKE